MDNHVEFGKALGRFFIAIAMIAFGAQHLWYAEFVTRLVPKLPAWIPGHSFLAYVFGAYFIATGVAFLLKKTARFSALVLAGTLQASLAFLYIPMLVATPADAGLWTKAGKALTISGGAFLIAGSLPGEPWHRSGAFGRIINVLEQCIPFGPYFLGAFFAFCGVLHFIYVQFVAGLVPVWVGGAIFWTYFSGVALIAAGVGISLRPTTRLAAALSALMVFLWVLMLHIPRALANVHDSNETTAVFEAIAVTGTALLVATRQHHVAAGLAVRTAGDGTAFNAGAFGPFQSVPTTAANPKGSTRL